MNIIVICLLGFMAAIGPLSTDIYIPGLPTIAYELGSTAAGVQLSLTACFIGLALGQVLMGPWSDEIGRRKPAIVSFGGFALASFLCATSGSLSMFLLWRFVQGVAGAGCIVLSRTIACDRYEGNQLTRFIALLVLIASIVPIAGPVLGGFVLQAFDWQAIFVLLGICGIIGTIWVLVSLPETLPKEQRITGGLSASLKGMKTLWNMPAYRGYLLVQGFASMGLFSYISGSPFILEEIYTLTPTEFSIFYGICSACLAISAQIFGRLCKSIGEDKVLWYGNVAGLLVGLLIVAVELIQPESPWAIMIILMLLISTCGITLPISFSSGVNSQQGLSGSASGLLGVISFLAGALAAPLVGLGGGHSMWPLAIIIVVEHIGSLLSMKAYINSKYV